MRSKYNLTLESVSRRFLISGSTLAKSFRRQMGITLHRYVVKRRMNAAHQLLAAGAPPSQVYGMVGYSDYSAFYRAFQNEFGYGPRMAGAQFPPKSAEMFIVSS